MHTNSDIQAKFFFGISLNIKHIGIQFIVKGIISYLNQQEIVLLFKP
jgi:hypothetical protein